MKRLKQFISDNTQFPEIYCDLDETLVAFLKGADTALKLQDLPPYKDAYWHDFSSTESDTLRWAAINAAPKFWEKLEWLPEGRRLWDFIKNYRPNILSAIQSRTPNCKAEKRAWLTSNIGLNSIRDIYLVKREEKKNYAIHPLTRKPNILIDDYLPNIEEWRRAGGIGILHINASTTIAELKKLGFV